MKNFLKSRTIQAAFIGLLGLLLVTFFSYIISSGEEIKTSTYFFASDYKNTKNSTELPKAECWTNSLSTQRPDAYRCIVNNEIHDPCFSDPINYSIISCPDDPYGDNHFFQVDVEKLPVYDSSLEESNNSPWFIRLEDNTKCGFMTGATALIAGMRIDYGCEKKYKALLLPIINDGELLKISCYKDSKISDCIIKEVWY